MTVEAQLGLGAPARVHHLSDPARGLDAVVVIDTDLFRRAAGGTRLAPDVTDTEVAALARAMTWKFAVYRIPLNGAKAGLRLDPSRPDRADVVAAYLAALAPLQDVFATGPDMGTSADDFLPPHRPAGEPAPLWAQSLDGMGMDDLATGQGVAAAAQVALARLGGDMDGATVAIEGFGKAGAGAARAFVKGGARLVATSTVHGMVTDAAGLDLDLLLDVRARCGDAWVEQAPARRQPREALFAVPCDVLVPGARPEVLTAEVARSVACRVVAPAANVPYAPGAVDVLAGRGIVALADFVTNAGGVHLFQAAGRGESAAECLRTVASVVTEATERVLALASASGVTPLVAARRLAADFLREAAAAR